MKKMNKKIKTLHSGIHIFGCEKEEKSTIDAKTILRISTPREVNFLTVFIMSMGFIIYLLFGINAQAQNDNNEKKMKGNLLQLTTNNLEKGIDVSIEFHKGQNFNHPTFVIWIEDMNEEYLATLMVTKSFATGLYNFAQGNGGFWKRESGFAERAAALPYWFKKYAENHQIKELPKQGSALPDAITSATPASNFVLKTKIPSDKLKFRILLEINQTWDWNECWTNDKFPDDMNYKSSAQPALVYAVTVDLKSQQKEYFLNPIGHSSYNGSDGVLNTNLETITTAKGIIERVKIIIP